MVLDSFGVHWTLGDGHKSSAPRGLAENHQLPERALTSDPSSAHRSNLEYLLVKQHITSLPDKYNSLAASPPCQHSEAMVSTSLCPTPTATMSTEKTAYAHDKEILPAQSLTTHVAGNALLVAADGHIRNLPIPSGDPNDPLNFSRWKKAAIVVACCWFCMFMLGLG